MSGLEQKAFFYERGLECSQKCLNDKVSTCQAEERGVSC